ncbi:eclosion hormone-like [Tachypleus tridentatus]|uniref:eclosion hormone-like n=1 Tax=Tachypleus tridentatus TaxID=6853 RepID=UPI003FD2B2B5
MNMCPVYIQLVVFVFLTVASEGVVSRSVGTCVVNCGQCKKMYGGYFMGQQCAEECIISRGQRLPDCNDPNSIGRYLHRLF